MKFFKLFIFLMLFPSLVVAQWTTPGARFSGTSNVTFTPIGVGYYQVSVSGGGGVGPQGPPGSNGPAGPVGPQGPPGLNGTNGLNGINGTNATGGTVSNLAIGDFFPLFTTSVSSPESFPSISFSPVNIFQNYVYASPDGSSGFPIFRSLVAADLPAIPSSLLTGEIPRAVLGKLTNHSDVVATPLSPGDTLTWSGTEWTNGIPPSQPGVITNKVYVTNFIGDFNGTIYGAAASGLTPHIKMQFTNNILISMTPDKNLAIETFDDYPDGAITASGLTNGFGFDNSYSVLSNGMTIVTTAFPGESKKCLSITNGEYIRRLSVSNNWTVAKIAIAYSISANGTSAITNTFWALGLCSSAGGGYGASSSQNTSNFFGFVSSTQDTSASPGETLNYTANSGFPYYSQGTTRGKFTMIKSGASTNSVNLTSLGLPLYPVYAAPYRRNVLFIQFEKVSVSASGANFFTDMENTSRIVSDQNTRFIGMLMNVGYNAANGGAADVNFTSPTTVNLAPTDVKGGLDCIDFYYNNKFFPIQIYGIYVQIISN